uniref:Uncharacterized protein n=1 Tax=Zea mays TaxID=4577 RepID=A0A804PBF8_MAIZE
MEVDCGCARALYLGSGCARGWKVLDLFSPFYRSIHCHSWTAADSILSVHGQQTCIYLKTPNRLSSCRMREIEDAAASAQEALTTATMVELAGGGGRDAGAMDREMQAKAEGMRRVLEMADARAMDWEM